MQYGLDPILIKRLCLVFLLSGIGSSLYAQLSKHDSIAENATIKCLEKKFFGGKQNLSEKLSLIANTPIYERLSSPSKAFEADTALSHEFELAIEEGKFDVMIEDMVGCMEVGFEKIDVPYRASTRYRELLEVIRVYRNSVTMREEQFSALWLNPLPSIYPEKPKKKEREWPDTITSSLTVFITSFSYAYGNHLSFLEERAKEEREMAVFRVEVDTMIARGKYFMYTEVDTLPIYPEGESQLQKDIQSTIIYPEEALKNGVSGKVVLGVTVGKNGEITNVRVFGRNPESLKEEAIRVVKTLKRFETPAMFKGIRVPVLIQVDVNFVLPK